MKAEKSDLLLNKERPQEKILLGVVHLLSLPGSPGCEDPGLEKIIGAARRDAERLLEAGFDGYVIENFGDLPLPRRRRLAG